MKTQPPYPIPQFAWLAGITNVGLSSSIYFIGLSICCWFDFNFWQLPALWWKWWAASDILTVGLWHPLGGIMQPYGRKKGAFRQNNFHFCHYGLCIFYSTCCQCALCATFLGSSGIATAACFIFDSIGGVISNGCHIHNNSIALSVFRPQANSIAILKGQLTSLLRFTVLKNSDFKTKKLNREVNWLFNWAIEFASRSASRTEE